MVSRVGWVRPALLIALAGLCFLPGFASAADPIGKASIGLQFGVGGYSMSDINSGLRRSATVVHMNSTADVETPGRLNYGFNFVSEVNYDVTRDIRVGVTYGRTSGTTKVDYVRVMSANGQGTTLIPRASYRLPWRPLENMTVRAYGGIVMLRNAKTRIEDENTSRNEPRLESLLYTGSGTGVTGGLAGEYTISDRFTLGLEMGYRSVVAKYKSGAYTITRIADPLSLSDADIPNNRTLANDSYLWGFMQTTHQIRGEEPKVRPLDSDFSGIDVKVALHLYIF
jgi:hypothetical protein